MVTDKDGVILIKAISSDLPKRILEPAFAATFSVSCDQIAKLGLGKHQYMVSTFSNYQLVQFNFSPLVLTFIAVLETQSAVLIHLGRELSESIECIKKVL